MSAKQDPGNQFNEFYHTSVHANLLEILNLQTKIKAMRDAGDALDAAVLFLMSCPESYDAVKEGKVAHREWKKASAE